MDEVHFSGGVETGDLSHKPLIHRVSERPSPRTVTNRDKKMANNTTVLWALIVLVGCFTIFLYVGVYLTKSLTLFIDALLNTTDLFTYAVNLYVEYLILERARGTMDSIIFFSSLLSAMCILGTGCFGLWNSINILTRPAEVEGNSSIDATWLLVFTIVGLCTDVGSFIIVLVFSEKTLDDGRKNLNIISAMVHVVIDMIRSILVLVGSIVIYLQQKKQIDWKIRENHMDAITSLLVVICIAVAFVYMSIEIYHLGEHGNHDLEMLNRIFKTKERDSMEEDLEDAKRSM